MSFTTQIKKPGDIIRSKDWNGAMQEIENLGANKLDLSGGALSGSLNIKDKLEIGNEKNQLLIDSSNEDHIMVQTGKEEGVLSIGNGAQPTVVLDKQNLGIGMEKPEEKLHVMGHVLSKPIIGQWYPSSHLRDKPPGYYEIKLDKEVFNTNSEYIERRENQVSISFKKKGLYQIVARTLVYVSPGNYGHFYLMKNNQQVDVDHSHSGTAVNWDDRHINYIGRFEAGDQIHLQVQHHNPTNYAYHEGPTYTRLTVLWLGTY